MKNFRLSINNLITFEQSELKNNPHFKKALEQFEEQNNGGSDNEDHDWSSYKGHESREYAFIAGIKFAMENVCQPDER